MTESIDFWLTKKRNIGCAKFLLCFREKLKYSFGLAGCAVSGFALIKVFTI